MKRSNNASGRGSPDSCIPNDFRSRIEDGDQMNFAYMPFTYLSHSTAMALNYLFGPVTLYQPLKSVVPQELIALSEQGLLDIHTPVEQEDDRLQMAVLEFFEWAKMNPGASMAGSEFLGTRQGEVPFYDDTSISRIRSQIKTHGISNKEKEQSEALFRLRLFLTVAQENDRATESLNRDLTTFNQMEQHFLSTLVDADEGPFNRQQVGKTKWPEDQGAKQTRLRLRSWAALAGFGPLPEILVTTSQAVMDDLLERDQEKIRIEKLAVVSTTKHEAGEKGLLKPALEELAQQSDLSLFDPLSLKLPGLSETGFRITLFAALNKAPIDLLHLLTPDVFIGGKQDEQATLCHTLIVLVEV